MPRRRETSWRKLAIERGRALEQAHAEIGELRNQLATSQAKLHTALTQIAEYERRLFGRTTERVEPVERELRRNGRAAVRTRCHEL